MISNSQLKFLVKKYKINESVIVREFVQLLFLKELYAKSFSKNIYFKGGTAIRLIYGGQRFSEDLDFTVELDEKVFLKKIWQLFKTLSNQHPFSFKQRETLSGKIFLLTAQSTNIKSKVFVKLDFSFREKVLDPVAQVLKTDYPIILQNFISCLSKNEILAEKIRAVFQRIKHKDLYDLWVLQELGARVDLNLIESKLKFYGEVFTKDKLLERLSIFSKDEFVKDLRPFVPINQRAKLADLFDYVIVYLKKLG